MLPADQSRITRGTVVTLRYAMSCAGERIEESDLDEPLVYLHGSGAIVPGLEQALEGRAIGQTLDLLLEPELAFGVTDPAKIEYLPRSAFPDDAPLEVGMQFGAEDQDGREVSLWVTDIDTDSVCVNGNHPLVDQTLRFEVEVLDVRAATAEELEHGHPHGADGQGCADEPAEQGPQADGGCGTHDCGCHN